jgi:hypothetical protein
MMRSEQEVTELRDHFARLASEATSMRRDGVPIASSVFIHNQQMKMALDWVLGDDTQIAFGHGTRGAGMKLVKP